ncbi:hypothetical protein SAMN05192574_10973 [Mucilaginibacter gossypiicola]|uniref:Transposase IS200-like domain-containing protein n=2 Tax=Mucilaginibacter gossypiicola TaxID=551995 RepID=A0A1H8QNS8_9SPHI|nr:hypothetical protein SAMN05192574_10973 [Mucilaginibacter gossypiicola]
MRMDDKYQGKYRTLSPRLTGWDYGSHALYFVTICTLNRVPYFGDILSREDNGEGFLQTSIIGDAAHVNWLKIPEFNPYVELDEFLIMPDHLHGILFFNKPHKSTWEVNKFGVQKDNLASVLRGYKSSVKKFANDNNIDFAWQPRYYDRVIRNDREHINIKQYIYDNPNNWVNGKEDFDNLYI